MRREKIYAFGDKWGIIVAFALGKVILHVATPHYGFHRDEFLYLIQGDHLAWGYMAVPPMIGFAGKVTNLILGDSLTAVRLVPALIGGLTILFTGMIAREMGGRHFAQFLACLAVFSSIAFLRINSLFQPVSLNVFFWVLGAWIIVRYLNTLNQKYIIGLGVVMGLALLTKYSVLVFALGIAVGLVLTHNRDLFRTRYPYVAAGLALLIWLPNLWWQWQNGIPLMKHMAELSKYQLTHVSPLGFLSDQLLFNANSLIIWLSGLYFLAINYSGKKYQPLFWTFVTVIVVLLTFSGKSYYSMGIYPMVIAAGAVIWERWTDSRKYIWVRVLIPILMVIGPLLLLPITLTIYPVPKLVEYCNSLKNDYNFSGPVTWEDATVHDLPQDWADMLGWEELVDVVAGAYHGLTPEEQSRTTIFAGNYGQAGAISYLGRKYGLPEAVSFNASFLYWSPEGVTSDIAIFVDSETQPTELFGSIQKVGEIRTQYARERGLPIYLCQEPKPYSFQAYKAERKSRLEGN